MRVWNFGTSGGQRHSFGKHDAWQPSVAGLKIMVRVLRLTILPEQPAWQWVICSLMWKLENWQTNLQEGNWISRETNERPCGWAEFMRCKRVRGVAGLLHSQQVNEALLFIYLRAKSESSVVLVFIIKMYGFDIEQWCVQSETTSLNITGIY